MYITLLCEPRSGSTNLANWFYRQNDFTVLFNPDDNPKGHIKNKWYQNGINPKEYEYKTSHLLVKEDYYQFKNYDDFISASDKVILLYREDSVTQIESWINAKKTNNWHSKWVYKKKFEDDDEKLFFTELKNSFKENFLNKDYFKISYEDLYQRNMINNLIEYLSIDSLKNNKFPVGDKYRIDVGLSRNII